MNLQRKQFSTWYVPKTFDKYFFKTKYGIL